MNIRLTTSSWGYESTFELDTGEPGSEEGPIPFLKVASGYRGEFTVELTQEDSAPLLRLITGSRIRPFVPGPMGLDGVTYKLALSEGTSMANFEWWTEAEKGWGALDRIAKAIIDLAEKKAGRPFPLFDQQ